MNKDISFLSKEKQVEAQRLTELLTSADIPLAKVILFGSYARGDHVISDKYSESNTTYEYKSDFDVLVVVPSDKIAKDSTLWHNLQNKIAADKLIKTPVSLLVDTLHFVNEKIREGNYFYVDVTREGIVLYDSGEYKLIEPDNVDPEQQRKIMQTDYEFWMQKAEDFTRDYEYNMKDGVLNNAAFHLSQTAESLYCGVLLTYTGYKPKTHNIEKIEELILQFLPHFQGLYKTASQKELVAIELLQRAYIEARYSQAYKVETNQLEFLADRLQELKKHVQELCEAKIKSL
jgi:HEPN domain-containing protein/predicted nucleotidyltransferase